MKKRAISRRDFLKVTGAVSAAGLLAACGGSNSSSTAASTAGSTAASTASGDGVSISLWTYPIGSWGGTESKLDDIIAAFNEVHPEITVTYETLDYQNGDNLVTSAITAKETPDIIMEGPERLVSNWGANNLMVDLSDLWASTKDDIAAVSESVVSACQLNGAYYEYPLCMTTHCMAINYEVFEQAGALQYLDESTRTWTTDNFVKAMETIRDSGLAAVPGIIYCGGQGGDQGTRALVNNLYSGTYTNPEHTEYTINSPENVKALELLKSMVDNRSLNANAGFQASDELQQFANGTAAVTFCWNASNKAQYASQVTLPPMPWHSPSDDDVPERGGGIWGFGIFDSGDDARIQAAKTFIQFVCGRREPGCRERPPHRLLPGEGVPGRCLRGAPIRPSRWASLPPDAVPGRLLQRHSQLDRPAPDWFNMLQEIMVNGTPAQEAADAFVAASNP